MARSTSQCLYSFFLIPSELQTSILFSLVQKTEPSVNRCELCRRRKVSMLQCLSQKRLCMFDIVNFIFKGLNGSTLSIIITNSDCIRRL